MDQFFVKDFTGGSFVLFSTSHQIAIGVIVLVNLWMLTLRRNQALRSPFRWTVAVLLIVNETLWHVWNLTTGQWTIQTMLPLHVCSVLVYLSALMLVTKNERLRSWIYMFAYFMGIAGASQAILTPDLGIYDFPHFRYFQVFLSHGAIVTAAIYMTVIEGYRPTWAILARAVVGLNIYMLFVGLVNFLIGSNYMFLAHKLETASLIDMLGPWPWYILALEGIGVVLFLLLYLPFAIRDWLDKRKLPAATQAASSD